MVGCIFLVSEGTANSEYMSIGLIMGLGMAIAKNFTLLPVHVHISLLGWATMAIAGLVYILIPSCVQNRLAKLHFWGHNIGLPLMISLAMEMLRITAAERAIAAGSALVVASLLLFSVNLIRNARLDAPR
jgi:cbb3-type cytochrome oxidase subunit 1